MFVRKLLLGENPECQQKEKKNASKKKDTNYTSLFSQLITRILINPYNEFILSIYEVNYLKYTGIFNQAG